MSFVTLVSAGSLADMALQEWRFQSPLKWNYKALHTSVAFTFSNMLWMRTRLRQLENDIGSDFKCREMEKKNAHKVFVLCLFTKSSSFCSPFSSFFFYFFFSFARLQYFSQCCDQDLLSLKVIPSLKWGHTVRRIQISGAKLWWNVFFVFPLIYRCDFFYFLQIINWFVWSKNSNTMEASLLMVWKHVTLRQLNVGHEMMAKPTTWLMA